MVWWDKVNTTVQRPTRNNQAPKLLLTMKGRLMFDQGIGGATGAVGLSVFPDKSILNSNVPGGIDRMFGPKTATL